MSSNYKASKEAFVSGTTGSSVLHINGISLVALSSIALHSALRSRLPVSRSIHFPTAWMILVVPLLLSMTVFAPNSDLLSALILLPTGLLLLTPRRESGVPLPSNQPSSPTSASHPISPPVSVAQSHSSEIVPLPALTTYRAHMLLMTILAILAVDFPVFPRSLAKCETFGVSLMDLGVGSFVFSQGVVSSMPLLKNRTYLSAPLKSKFFIAMRKTLPILFLGLARVVLVKGTDYPVVYHSLASSLITLLFVLVKEHESEYGTHWNFFITLALLPPLQVLLHPVIVYFPVSLVGLSVALLQQIGLSLLGMQNFVLTAPRTNLLSANKEGIASLGGYFAIHLLGLSTGTLILSPSPSYFRRIRNSGAGTESDNHKDHPAGQRQNDKTAIELCSYAVVWWALMGLIRAIDIDGGVSRRMVNLSYILWVAAFNTSFILGYFLLDLYFFPPTLSESGYDSTKLKVPADNTNSQQQRIGGPPPLLEAINKNGLALFLLANVVTGLINLAMPTMYVADLRAMLVLCGYAFGISAVAWVCRERRMLPW